MKTKQLNRLLLSIYRQITEAIQSSTSYISDKIGIHKLPISSTVSITDTGVITKLEINVNDLKNGKKYCLAKDDGKSYASNLVISFISYQESLGQYVSITNLTINDFGAIISVDNNEEKKILNLCINNKRYEMNYNDCSSLDTIIITDYSNVNYLETNNETEYIPTKDYHPATKKYVDDIKASIVVPTKTSELTNDSNFLTEHQSLEALATKENPVFTNSISLGRKADTTIGKNSFAVGNNVEASGFGSHAEGFSTKVTDSYGHAEGGNTTAGYYAHAEGNGTTASGRHSHAEGQKTTANSMNSHAEGYGTTASAEGAHAEGRSSTASDIAAHAEGIGTKATGRHSHAEGNSTTASGWQSHAEGSSCIASGVGSHAEGYGTTASGDYQHVQGKYNIEDTEGKYAHIVGNGTNTTKSNAHTLDWEGNAWYAGKLSQEATPTEDKDLATKKYVDDNVLTPTAKTLLATLLQNISYSTDQSANVAAFLKELGVDTTQTTK